MTLNLPFLYVLWLEEYCQTSPNKNKSPNLWTRNKHLSLLYFCYKRTQVWNFWWTILCILGLTYILAFVHCNHNLSEIFLYGSARTFWRSNYNFMQLCFHKIFLKHTRVLHCKCLLGITGVCRFSLQYVLKRAVRITEKAYTGGPRFVPFLGPGKNRTMRYSY